MPDLLQQIYLLNKIGIALSMESDTQKLLEVIMMGAKQLTHADGGSLYFVKDGQLRFEITSNDSLNTHMGGTSGRDITFPAIPMKIAGKDNHSNVVSHCVLTEKSINIIDAYHEEGYDFTGTRNFDRNTGYRTMSVLTIPLRDHENEIIGALQLINAQSPAGDKTIPFSAVNQQLAESLASQAAVALTQRRLITELQVLFESFTKMIASAIDDKSPYTGGHCRRIPVLTMMLAEAAHDSDLGVLQNFVITDKDRYELETAAWLHDCGKVVTPEHVMDKSTKLETIVDRVHLIASRIEILIRDAEITFLRDKIDLMSASQSFESVERRYQKQCQQYRSDLDFITTINVGGEFMTDDDIERVSAIARLTWLDQSGNRQQLITEDELSNLCIRKGTLNDAERQVINNHIVVTIKMLESLPFPKNLQNVPEYAGGHHEKMDGTGYPKGLRKEEMSIQARIIAIADIFEALSANDRPYKEGKKLSECLRIMGVMKKENHIDPDIFDIFVKNKVYMDYAVEFLDPEQIDEIDESIIQGYLI
jgi:HD-GYP domain-containing protein (c-di-GMP phosphodiesterase class II)